MKKQRNDELKKHLMKQKIELVIGAIGFVIGIGIVIWLMVQLVLLNISK